MYEETIDELTQRILALIPEHPEILTIESVLDLFKVDGVIPLWLITLASVLVALSGASMIVTLWKNYKRNRGRK